MDSDSDVPQFERTLITDAIIEVRCIRCGFAVGWSPREHLLPILEKHHKCKTGEPERLGANNSTFKRSA